MIQKTTTNTNTTRRPHPAAVRAALRSLTNYPDGRKELGSVPMVFQIVYPDASTVVTQYDPNYGNVTQHADENGVITQNTYDAKGNLLKTVEALGLPEQRSTEYTYDASGQLISMTRKGDANTADATTQFAYDAYGNVSSITDAEGGITSYTYDVMGHVLTTTDPRGNIWSSTYDSRGRLVSTTDPLNRTSSIAYDKTGRPVSVTDPAKNTSTLGFDPAGKLLSVTDPYGATTSFTYDAAGNLVTVTDAANHTVKRDYDPDGRFVKYTDGNNNVTQLIYGDSTSGLNRLLTKVIYPTRSQELKYDNRNRVTQSNASAAGIALVLDGSSTQTSKNQYDAAGNLTSVTDPASRSASTKYNAFGQASQTSDPAGGITQYGYDARGNLISVTDPKGNIHRFSYDRLDRMVMEIRPLGQSITYAYDANGNLIQITDPKGQVNKYTFDAANRRIREDHYLTASDAAPAKTITYTYNALDRLTGYNDGTTQGTYTYDAQQIRRAGESVNYGSFSLSTSTAWNALGQKTSITYPDGAQYSYAYDANNQLSMATLPTGSITINSYFWTVPSQITLPGGTVRNQTFDGLLRTKSIDVKDPGQSQVMSYQYTYDITSNIIARATEQGTANYSYDTLDHLTNVAYTTTAQATTPPPANESYTYDPIANRLTSAKTSATWTYDANSQLISAGSTSYIYDANGNTLSQTDSLNAANNKNYVYDTDNRLIEVHDGNNALIASYTYDPFGRRLSKTVVSNATSTTQYYFYSAEGLISEMDASGQVTRSYGYAPGSGYSTNPLFTKIGSQYYYYQNDHLGTPMKLLNQIGTVVWSATYDAFGNATVDPASTVTNNLRFPGQYYDQETGLHNNWMRYYNPATGRYVTSDPIGLAGGINTYTYVNGNPLKYVDPKGLAIWDVTDAFEVGAVAGVGGKYVNYTLKSPCNNGKRYVITVKASGISAGLGLECKLCFNAPMKIPLGGQFNDRSPEPNPNAFNGGYLNVSAGASFMGFGGDYGDTVLGQAVDLRSWNTNLGFGNVSAEFSGTMGTSTVTHVETESCGCDSKK